MSALPEGLPVPFEVVTETEVDSRGRVSLGRAGAEPGGRYRVARNIDGVLLLTPVVSIPERELIVWEKLALAERIRIGIAETQAGRTIGLGDFTITPQTPMTSSRMGSYQLRFATPARETLNLLAGSPRDAAKPRKVRRTLGLLQINPCHREFRSHQYENFPGAPKAKAWDSYVEIARLGVADLVDVRAG